jgi:hypothetical protein
MAEGFSRAFLPGNGDVSPGAIIEVLGPDVVWGVGFVVW